MALLANVLLFAVWIATHLDSVAWIADHYARDDRRLEAMLFVGVVVLAGRRFGVGALARPAALAPVPLAILVACALIDAGDLHILRASLFVAGLHALTGLYASPTAWRASLPWAALLAATLPFGAFSDIYLGFPARVLTADVVGRGLEALGVATLSRDTILVLDRPGALAAVNIDVPCSGVRSLWTAGVFLLAAAAVEGRRMDRWFWAALASTGTLLIVANTARVGTLVMVGSVWNQPEIAALLHVPLGLAGFTGSAVAGWLVLRRAGVPAAGPALPPRARLAPALAVALAAVHFAVPAPPPAPSPVLAVTVTLPVAAVAVAPTAAEIRFFAGVGAPPPVKWRFDADGLAGTALLLPTRAWRVHHLPSACLLGQGLSVEGPWTVLVEPAFAVRSARVGGGTHTAVWWFQAPDRVTDDLGARTWAAVSGGEDRWVLASLLLDGDLAGDDPALRRLLLQLKHAIRTGLAEEAS